MDQAIADKYAVLKDNIAAYNSAIIAFSGGIDSSLVAYVAGQVLGERATAITSATVSLKRSDLASPSSVSPGSLVPSEAFSACLTKIKVVVSWALA